MKQYCVFSLLIVLQVFFLGFGHARTWAAGTETVTGDFVRVESDGQTVVIQQSDGKSVRINRVLLSQADQNYLASPSGNHSKPLFEEFNDNPLLNSHSSKSAQSSEKTLTADMSNCYALLIGVDEYNDSRDNLRYCGSDMKLLAKSLEKVGFPKDQVHVMTSDAPIGNRPTKANIIKALDSLILLMDESCTLFVAFGGHGLTDESTNKAYLCPSDTDVTDKSSLISRDEVFEKLDSCKASCKVFLVDACRNMVSLKRGLGIHALSDPVGDKQYGFVLLSSCSKEQYAHETSNLGDGHGVFTYYLVEGLRGEAADKDGIVTVFSLFTYASKATRNYVYRNFNHDVQQPTLRQGGEMPDFQIAQIGGNSESEELYHQAEIYATGDFGRGEQDWEIAIKFYRQAAKLEHVRAMICLGYCYETGTGIGQDYLEALNWYRKAAQQESPEAYICLGKCYQHGYGVPQDESEAQKWFEKGFHGLYEQRNNGDPITQYNLGYCYELGAGVFQDSSEAVKWYRRAAQQDLAVAEFRLGLCCLAGEGIPKNDTEAVTWLRKAANQGHCEAQCNLGVCYEKGYGVQQNSSEAVLWFRKAAEQGNSNAQCNLGLCYENGYGVSQDYYEAVKWYLKAANSGYIDAQYALGMCYQSGTGVPRDEVKAVNWYRKAAQHGDARAQCNLGLCYASGIGIPENKAEAVNWYRKSAEQGNARAQCLLGMCYESGEGTPKNKAEAIMWFRKAAQQEFSAAEYVLGFYYENGISVTADQAEALNWYRRAAQHGFPGAQLYMGQCYENGKGVPQNKTEAVKWYRQAADNGEKEAIAALKRLGLN